MILSRVPFVMQPNLGYPEKGQTSDSLPNKSKIWGLGPSGSKFPNTRSTAVDSLALVKYAVM